MHARRLGLFRSGLVLWLLLCAAQEARAQQGLPPDVQNGFACDGVAGLLATRRTISEIAAARDRWLAVSVPRYLHAYHACVIAELMRRLGDARAPIYYRQAILLGADGPAYELWYARYLGRSRGAGFPVLGTGGPLLEDTEAHDYRGLAELKQHPTPLSKLDWTTKDWLQRGLADLYQRDGLPLLPRKAYPYGRGGIGAPGMFFAAAIRLALDTNDFNAALYSSDVSDVRSFASQAAFSASAGPNADLPGRLHTPLSRNVIRGIVRDPLRAQIWGRVRLRWRYLGAVDLSYSYMHIFDSQITRFRFPPGYPDVQHPFNDVIVHEIGASIKRAFDLYPAFDLFIDAGYKRVYRTGVIEYNPGDQEALDVIEIKPVLSRYLGPTQLSIGANYVYMSIPDTPMATKPYLAPRGRSIIAPYVALSFPLLLPRIYSGSLSRKYLDTRGGQLYAGVAIDDECYGPTTVHRRDYFAGLSLRGLGRGDVTLQSTVFDYHVALDLSAPMDGRPCTVFDRPAIYGPPVEDFTQGSRFYRTTLVIDIRLIDAEELHGLPRPYHPVSLHLLFPLRQDLTLQGPCDLDAAETWSGPMPACNGPSGTSGPQSHDFDNFRLGAALSVRFISRPLRGTSLFVSGGYDFQYFYVIGKALHMAHIDLGTGF